MVLVYEGVITDLQLKGYVMWLNVNNSILNFTSKPTLVKPDNIRYTINVTLEQIFLSKKRKLQILRKIKCKKCNGNGSIYKCNKCNHIYNSFINVCENCCNFSIIKSKCDCNNGIIEDDW